MALQSFPPAEDILIAMSIVWFFEASEIRLSNEPRAFDILFDVADALEYANGLYMWDQACKEANLNPAAELAKRRHAENYALTGDALKYWREKIDPTLSASKAANELVRVVPLSHKKLAELVSAEKKKKT